MEPPPLSRMLDNKGVVNEVPLANPQINPFTECPNEVITMILKNYPLQQMMYFRLVCTRWKEVVDGICVGMKSLKLFTNKDGVQDFCENLVHLNLECTNAFQMKPLGQDDDLLIDDCHFDKLPLFLLLPQHFPNIETLVLHLDYTDSLVDLPLFLEKWSGTLTTLVISGDNRMRDWDAFSTRMCHSIMLCTKLKQLYLFCPLVLQIKCLSIVLQNLELIYLNTACATPVVMAKLGPSCKRVIIDDYYWDDMFERELQYSLASNYSLTENLSHLNVSMIKNRFLKYYCSSFGSLQSLDVIFSNLPKVIYFMIEYIEQLIKMQFIFYSQHSMIYLMI